MKYRKLGKSFLVSVVGFGCWQIGGSLEIAGKSFGYGAVDENEAKKAIETAIDYGINFFDTSDFYGLGRSERILGKVTKNLARKVKIATKVGYVADGSLGVVTDFSYHHIKASCERSLKRLGRDHVYLYQLHAPPSAGEEEEAVTALEELKKEGKILFYGVSVANQLVRGAELLKKYDFDTIQFYFNILNRDAEEILFPIIAEKDIGAIVASPLARGLLTSRFDRSTIFPLGDIRSNWNDGCKDRDWFLCQLRRIESLAVIAKEYGMDVFELNFSYIMGHREVSVIIPGARSAFQAFKNASLPYNKKIFTRAEIQELKQKLADA